MNAIEISAIQPRSSFTIDKTYNYLLLDEATVDLYDSADKFVCDYGVSSLFIPNGLGLDDDPHFIDDPDNAVDLDTLIHYLTGIWDVAHLTVKDIREHTGLTQGAFAKQFDIPYQLLKAWEDNSDDAPRCPRYVIMLLAQVTGMVDVV